MSANTEQRKLAVIIPLCGTDMVGYLAGLGARFVEHALPRGASILYLQIVRPNAHCGGMFDRPFWLHRIEAAWKDAPIVWLCGVRRSGMTTLVQQTGDPTLRHLFTEEPASQWASAS